MTETNQYLRHVCSENTDALRRFYGAIWQGVRVQSLNDVSEFMESQEYTNEQVVVIYRQREPMALRNILIDLVELGPSEYNNHHRKKITLKPPLRRFDGVTKERVEQFVYWCLSVYEWLINTKYDVIQQGRGGGPGGGRENNEYDMLYYYHGTEKALELQFYPYITRKDEDGNPMPKQRVPMSKFVESAVDAYLNLAAKEERILHGGVSLVKSAAEKQKQKQKKSAGGKRQEGGKRRS